MRAHVPLRALHHHLPARPRLSAPRRPTASPRDSDVDLVVVAKEFRPVFRGLTPILGKLLRQGAPPVGVVVLTSAEFRAMEMRRAAFYRTLMREGEALLA